jgi:O-antigen/teichoic acid export membrane protein
MNNKKSLKMNYIYTLFYRVIAMLVPLITTPYIARVLGSEGVGIYSYTYSITAYFILFGNFGSATYAQITIGKSQDDKYSLSKFFYEVLIARLILFLIVIFIYVTLILYIAKYKMMFVVLSTVIFTELLNLGWFYRGVEDFKSLSIRNSIVKLISVILIFLYVKRTEDLYLYALIVNGSSVIGNVLLFLGLQKYLVRVKIKDLEIMKHFSRFVVYFTPAIASTINSNLDKTMLGIITTSKFENGYYEQSNKIGLMILTVFSSLNVVLRSRMSALWDNELHEEIKIIIEKWFLLVLCLVIAIFFGLNGISRKFVPLFFGPGYDKVSLLINIFSFTIIFKAISNFMLEQFFMTSGRMRMFTKIIFWGTTVNAILNFILIVPLKSIGASLATLGSEFAILSATYYFNRSYLNKYFNYIKIKSSLIKYLFSGIIMFIIVKFLLFIKSPIDFYYLFFVILIGIITYFLLLFIFNENLILFIKKKVYYKFISEKGGKNEQS